jgi:hypothetical protein
MERITYLLKVNDLFLVNYNLCYLKNLKKEFQEDIMEIEKEINKLIIRLINIYINELFGELIKFVKTYTVTSDDENLKLEAADLQDSEPDRN